VIIVIIAHKTLQIRKSAHSHPPNQIARLYIF
jgi:hypothetical protein